MIFHVALTVMSSDPVTYRVTHSFSSAPLAYRFALDQANALTQMFGFPVTYKVRKGRV